MKTIRLHDILLGILVLMIFIHRYVPVDVSSLWQCLLAGLVYLLVRASTMEVRKYMALVIIGVGLCEVGIMVLQDCHFLSGNHRWFDVTGTFGNPGPLGGFLGIICAGVFNAMMRRWKDTFKVALLALTFGLLLYGVLLSSSRAGLLAAFTGVLLVFVRRIKLLLADKRTNRAVTECAFVVVAICMAFLVLYSLKPDSANGRLFVWINTLRMMCDNALLGLGTGGWIGNYMLYQAGYFAINDNSRFAVLADNVAYPYNELLHIGAEHGLLGISLFLWVVLEIVRSRPSNILADGVRASFCAFVVFSLFSYPFCVLELLLLFAFLTAAIETRPVIRFRVTRCVSVLYFAAVFIVLPALCFSFYGLYRKSLYDKDLYKYFRYNLEIMYKYAQNEEMQNTMERREQLEQLAFICPDSDTYCWLADELTESGSLTKAEGLYREAINMVPSRITPKYKLFKLHLSKGDTISAISLGCEILSSKPKVESTKSLRMKGEIIRFFEKHQ